MRYWITYDLGLQSNYEGLYEWLDRHDAEECGDSAATLVTDMDEEQVCGELKDVIDDKTRVYVVSKRDNGAFTGKFMFGKRKRAPWNGYAALETVEDRAEA